MGTRIGDEKNNQIFLWFLVTCMESHELICGLIQIQPAGIFH